MTGTENNRHRFTPIRPGTELCIVMVPGLQEVCARPAGHPIHDAANTPAEARTSISDRTAAALTAVASIGKALARYDDPARWEAELQLIEAALRGSA